MNNGTIREVEKFWNENPLFSGEGVHEVGTPAWFGEHERIYIADCFAGCEPDRIFMEDITTETRVLDVGCGPGFWVRYFLRKGVKNVSACDLTQNAVDIVNKSLIYYGLIANITVGNAEELPFQDGSFDHINCQGVIHHTPNTQKCIQEFHRVLRDDGTVCFSVYHKNFILRHPFLLRAIAKLLSPFIGLKGRGRERLLASGQAEEIVRMYDGENNPIGKSFTVQEIQYMVKGLFEVLEIGYFFFPARAFPFKIPKFFHRWMHSNFGLMVVIRGKKLNGQTIS